MDCFSFDLDTKVYFGEGIVKEALTQQKDVLGDSVLVVSTGRSLERNGYIDQLINVIKEIVPNITISKWTKVSANPDIDEIAEAIDFAREFNIDSVIGFGGGSGIDAAKAVAIGLSSEIGIKEIFLEGEEQKYRKCKLVAIPTTAGTGSELSKAAIVSSRATGVKGGIRGAGLIPDVAIVDPTYTYSVPKKITAETGFDVLAHAVESYVAVKSNIYSELLSEEAIRIVGEYLPKLIADSDNQEARKKMSFASMLMGLNLKNVGTGLPHRMQYPIGALSDSSHGAGLMVLYPSWIINEYEVSPVKVKRALELLGYKNVNDAVDAKGKIEDFINKIHTNQSIRDLGVIQVDEIELAQMVSGNIKNDPLGSKEGILEKIYKDALD